MFFKNAIVLFLLTQPNIIENQQVVSEQVTVEVKPGEANQLEKFGNIIETITITEDKYPKPELDIVGNENVPPGEIIVLELVGEVPDKVAKVDVTWTVLEIKSTEDSWKWNEKRVKVWPDGLSCVLSAGLTPNRFYCLVDVTYLYIDGNDITQTKTKISEEIVIGKGPEPNPNPVPPNPNPEPEPEPEPEIPEGFLGLTKISYDIASKNDMDPKVAGIIMMEYNETKRKIGDGEYGPSAQKFDKDDPETWDSILKALTDNKTRIRERLEKNGLERPAYFLGDENKEEQPKTVQVIFDAFNSGELDNLSTLGRCFTEINVGLGFIAKEAGDLSDSNYWSQF